MKRTLVTALLVTLAMLTLLSSALAAEPDTVANASEISYFEIPRIDPRYPSASVIDNSEDDPNAVPLADRRAVKCIDRLKLPQFARDFYSALERESKPASRSGLGRDGALIDPAQSPETQTINGEEVYTIHLSLPAEDVLRASGFQFTDYKEFVGNCLGATYGAFEWDHPEVFWLHGGYGFFYDLTNYVLDVVLAYKGFPSDKANWDIRMEDYRDSEAIKKDIDALSQSVDSIIREAGRTSSNYEKITYFNEWLTTNNQYNYTIAYTGGSAGRIINTALAALTTKDGRPGGRTGLDGPICSSYAKAFLLLCQEADIPCFLMTGANHVWNYVQVNPSDSRWYAVDVTWNDPILSGNPTMEEYVGLGANSNMESTAYTLVGADTIVYSGGAETFLDQHPVFSMIADDNHVYANFKMAPELSKLAYVDSLAVQDLDVPVEGAVPDTSAALTASPKSGHHPTAPGIEELFTAPTVTWSPALTNGRFAAGTAYTATISYTPRRQGYGLTSADASKITVPGAESVSVGADGTIRAVFPKTGGDSGLHGSVSISVGGASSQAYSGEAYAAKSEMIVLHIAPDPGYRLSSIQVIRADNGQTVSLSGGGSVYTFAMPDSDVSVQAVFSKS